MQVKREYGLGVFFMCASNLREISTIDLVAGFIENVPFSKIQANFVCDRRTGYKRRQSTWIATEIETTSQ